MACRYKIPAHLTGQALSYISFYGMNSPGTASQLSGYAHVTAQESCSWYEFAGKIFEFTNASVHLSKADPGEFPAKVPRPKYSVLENKALQSVGLDIMPHWSVGLQRYVKEIKGEIW